MKDIINLFAIGELKVVNENDIPRNIIKNIVDVMGSIYPPELLYLNKLGAGLESNRINNSISSKNAHLNTNYVQHILKYIYSICDNKKWSRFNNSIVNWNDSYLFIINSDIEEEFNMDVYILDTIIKKEEDMLLSIFGSPITISIRNDKMKFIFSEFSKYEKFRRTLNSLYTVRDNSTSDEISLLTSFYSYTIKKAVIGYELFVER